MPYNTVATTCLGRGTWSTIGWVMAANAPAGTTTIVKSIVYWNPGATSTLFNVWLQAGDSAASLRLAAETIPAGETFVLECWHVLNSGDQLALYSDVADAQYWVSGSSLLGDSPYEPPDALVLGTLPAPGPDGLFP